MVIVDTTVWIDYLRGTSNPEVEWLDRELQRRRLGLTELILCDCLQVVRDRGAFVRVSQVLLNFVVFETGGINLAVAAAENYRKLRERGRTVRRTIDCLIATFCIEGGHALLHRDRDFDVFEKWVGLRVIHA